MQLRRSRALVAAAVVLASSTLASCGFEKATQIPYTPAEGTNARGQAVDVLGAVVVASQPDSGTFIASLANSTSGTETFESLGGAKGNAIIPGDFTPVDIGPSGYVNLADDNGQNLGVPISGSFGAGDFLPLTLNFASGLTVTMNVPVTYACQEYTGLDKSAASSSASPSGSTSARPSVSARPSPTTSSSASASTSESPSGGETPLTSSVPSTDSSQGSSEASATAAGQATPSPSDTGGATGSDTGSSSAASSASPYLCGSSGGTGGRN